MASNRQDSEEQSESAQPADVDFVPIVYAEAATTQDGEIKKILILVVDDVPGNNLQEIDYLKNKGYDVITTASTSSAMALLHSGIAPEIIISDMGRREDSIGGQHGYNPTAGLRLIEEIRVTGRTTPVIIFTTSDGVERYKEETMSLGGNDIVYQSRDLYAAVEDALPVAPAYVEEG